MGYDKYNKHIKENRQESAAAISYNPQKNHAPVVVASGHGVVAQKIIAIALENGIKIHKDENLVKILTLLEVNSFIPVETYDAIAKILSKLSDMDKKLSNNEKKNE